LTFVTALGAMTMKLIAEPILRRYGFRRVLVVNALLASVLTASPGMFYPGMAWVAMAGVLYVGGLSRSLQFTAINAIGYAEVPPERLSSATSFASVLQQLSGTVGITLAAMSLELQGWLHGGPATALENFAPTFGMIALLTLISGGWFSRLPRGAGRGLVRAG
jgi:hypothetical protein